MLQPEQKKAVNKILQRANAEIYEVVGSDVVISYLSKEPIPFPHDEVKHLFAAMCAVWDIDMKYLKTASREHPNATMRTILWYAGKVNFPFVSQKALANMLNRRDHTNVIRAVKMSRDFIKIEDKLFMQFYTPVKHLINE